MTRTDNVQACIKLEFYFLISKILEKVEANQVQAQMKNNLTSISNPLQSDYKKHHCIESALVVVVVVVNHCFTSLFGTNGLLSDISALVKVHNDIIITIDNCGALTTLLDLSYAFHTI